MANSKHIYTACAVGVGAVLTNPAGEMSWAASCLPIIGGVSVGHQGSVDWPSAANRVLHFDSAHTEVRGRKVSPGVYETIIQKTVTNLNILGRVQTSIDARFTFIYTVRQSPGGPRQRDPIDVSVSMPPWDITVDTVTRTVSLNQGIISNAGRDFKRFKGSGPGSIDDVRPIPQHHKHEHGEVVHGGHNQGVILTALAEPMDLFAYADPDFGRWLPEPSDMEVYVGEWWGEPYRQSITLLRVVLKGAKDPEDPSQTAWWGEIVVDGEDNGREMP
jgi:hypothetical protein